MIRQTKTLNAWGTPDFEDILKQEIAQIGAEQLPLQQGLSTSSYAIDNKLSVMILNVSEEAGFIRAKAGIFYTGIIASCSCADDPTPINEHNEYCVVQLDIDKITAETTVTLLAELKKHHRETVIHLNPLVFVIGMAHVAATDARSGYGPLGIQ
jgi:hypothetical protein